MSVVVRVGISTPIASMDPRDALDFAGVMVQRQVFETLFETTPEGPAPRLARALPSPTDDDQLRIELRADRCFSDGAGVTAEPVVASLAASPLLLAELSPRVDGEAIIVRSHGRSPTDIAAALSKPWAAIARGAGSDHLGTGPYRLHETSAPRHTVLVRNERYPGPPAAIERLEFRTFEPEDDGIPLRLVWALQREEVDVTRALPRELATSVDWMDRVMVPTPSTALVWVNTERVESVDDRAALLAAIDRRGLLRQSSIDADTFGTTAVIPRDIGGRPDGVEFDPDRARRRFAERRPRLEMIVIWGPRAYLPSPRAWAKLIVEQLAAVGVDVVPIWTQDPLDYQRRLRTGDYDLVLGGWSADSDDPCDVVEALYADTCIPRPGDEVASGCNFARIRDPELRATLVAMRRAPSPDARRAHVDHAQRRGASLSGILPLCHGATCLLHARTLDRIPLDRAGVPRFSEARFRVDSRPPETGL